MPIILHYMDISPPCCSVLLTAKVLGLKLELNVVDILTKEENKTESFLKMNPCHTIPTMDDNGFYLWESRAIIGYLVQTYGKDDKLYPRDPKKRGLVDNMLHFDGTFLYPSLIEHYDPQLLFGKPEDMEKRAVAQERLSILDKLLERHPYAAGNGVTIADLSIINSLSVPKAAGISFEKYPNIIKWSERLKNEFPFLDEITKHCADQLAVLLKEKLAEMK